MSRTEGSCRLRAFHRLLIGVIGWFFLAVRFRLAKNSLHYKYKLNDYTKDGKSPSVEFVVKSSGLQFSEQPERGGVQDEQHNKLLDNAHALAHNKQLNEPNKQDLKQAKLLPQPDELTGTRQSVFSKRKHLFEDEKLADSTPGSTKSKAVEERTWWSSSESRDLDSTNNNSITLTVPAVEAVPERKENTIERNPLGLVARTGTATSRAKTENLNLFRERGRVGDHDILGFHIQHPDLGVPQYPGDANPAFYFNKRYHLHYIFHPRTKHERERLFCYAHVSSANLVDWEWHETELYPNRTGHGMFSGTGMLVGHDGMFFSAATNSKNRDGHGAEEVHDKQLFPAIIYHGQGSYKNQIVISKHSATSNMEKNFDQGKFRKNFDWEKPFTMDIAVKDGGPAVLEWDPDFWKVEHKTISSSAAGERRREAKDAAPSQEATSSTSYFSISGTHPFTKTVEGRINIPLMRSVGSLKKWELVTRKFFEETAYRELFASWPVTSVDKNAVAGSGETTALVPASNEEVSKPQELPPVIWQGGVWQSELPQLSEDISCPNFFEIDPAEKIWMLLLISHNWGCRYFLGRFDTEVDVEHHSQLQAEPLDGRGSLKSWMNKTTSFVPFFHARMNWRGRNFFAPESVWNSDKRKRVMWAWLAPDDDIKHALTAPEPPAEDLAPWDLVSRRSVQSLPREISLTYEDWSATAAASAVYAAGDHKNNIMSSDYYARPDFLPLEDPLSLSDGSAKKVAVGHDGGDPDKSRTTVSETSKMGPRTSAFLKRHRLSMDKFPRLRIQPAEELQLLRSPAEPVVFLQNMSFRLGRVQQSSRSEAPAVQTIEELNHTVVCSLPANASMFSDSADASGLEILIRIAADFLIAGDVGEESYLSRRAFVLEIRIANKVGVRVDSARQSVALVDLQHPAHSVTAPFVPRRTVTQGRKALEIHLYVDRYLIEAFVDRRQAVTHTLLRADGMKAESGGNDTATRTSGNTGNYIDHAHHVTDASVSAHVDHRSPSVSLVFASTSTSSRATPGSRSISIQSVEVWTLRNALEGFWNAARDRNWMPAGLGAS